VKEAVAYHALNSPIKYSPVGGIPELREKIAKFYNETFGGNYKKDNVLVTVGSTEGLSSTLKTILAKGDEVLIPTPAYVGYEPLITVSQAKTIFMDLEENNFVLTEKILEKYVTEKTKLIILTYPNNPSGITLPEEEMIKIVEFLKDKEIYLLSDEIYAQIAFEKFTSFAKYSNILKEQLIVVNGFSKSHSMTGYRLGYTIASENLQSQVKKISQYPQIAFEKFTSFAKYSDILKEQLIVVNGFSKSHSMTGYRLGYTIASENLQSQVKKISQYTVTSASTLSQYGAIAALDYCSDTTELSEIYKKRVYYFVEELEKLGFKCLKPKGAFYVFATYKTIDKFKDVDSFDFVLDLLEKTELAIVPGVTFQVEGYLRFSIVHNLPVLEEAIARLKKYIESK